MSLFTPLWLINAAVVASLMLAAWRWGDAPERICAAVFVFNLVADRAYHAAVGRGTIYLSVDLGHLVIGIASAAALIGVALWANRTYPLWLSAFQGLVVVSHFAREASETVGVLAYALLTYAPSILQIAILALGIALHRRRTRMHGRLPAWRRSSSRSRDVKRPKSPGS